MPPGSPLARRGTAVGVMIIGLAGGLFSGISPCTFTITLSHSSGVVAIRPAAFTILDELGHLRYPRVTAINGGPPAAAVAHGQTVTLILRTVLPIGNGQLRWAPGTAKPIVSWDFDVEID